MFQGPDSRSTHHHGLLAGLGAGTAAVILAGAFTFAVWHRVSGVVGDAVIVLVWVVMLAASGLALAAAAYGVLWLRHRTLHPETLARRTVTAEVVPVAPAAPEMQAPQPAGELPAGTHTHYHFDSAEAVQAALQAMQERQITESHHGPA